MNLLELSYTSPVRNESVAVVKGHKGRVQNAKQVLEIYSTSIVE